MLKIEGSLMPRACPVVIMMAAKKREMKPLCCQGLVPWSFTFGPQIIDAILTINVRHHGYKPVASFELSTPSFCSLRFESPPDKPVVSINPGLLLSATAS